MQKQNTRLLVLDARQVRPLIKFLAKRITKLSRAERAYHTRMIKKSAAQTCAMKGRGEL